MGKLLVIIIVLVAAIIAVILLSVQERVEDVPEVTSQNLAQIQAKSLCNNALIYGIKQIEEGNITFTNDEFLQEFTNFEVMEGVIDSIQYTSSVTNDTIEIISYASYQNADETIQHKSSTLVCWVPTYAQAAMSANGNIEVGGSADITGDLIENSDPPLSFEDLFGMTKADMKDIADNHLEDPPNNPAGVEDITWVSFTDEGGSFKVTTAAWEGSGILVIDGDAHFSGGTFNGIMWIIGTLFINGNNGFNGAIYVEGGIEYEDTTVLGNCQIAYDFGAILAAFANASLVLDYELKILSWFEDSQ